MKKISLMLLSVILIITLFSLLCSCSDRTNIDKVSKDLDSYKVSMSFDSNRIDAAQEVFFTNRTENALNEIWFNVYANAYREGAAMPPVATESSDKVYRKGASYGGITVQNVKINQTAATHKIEGADMTLMKVKLVEALYPNESVTISFDYRITLANAWHRLGYGNNTVNLGNMIPLLCPIENNAFKEYAYYAFGDPFVSELANFEVTLIAPSKYVVASTGNRMSKENADSSIKYSFSAKAVRDFAMVMSEKFILMNEKVGEVNINYYYFSDNNPQESLKCAVDAFTTYSALFGEYPYSQLSVVQADLYPAGMEYPQLVTISADTVQKNMNDVIAHEIAHQWWYGLIGSNQVKNAWMDEGLAEFSTMLFLKKNPSYGSYDEQINEAHRVYKLYVDVTLNYKKNIDTSMNRPLGGYSGTQEYTYMCYTKSMLMFESLYKIMGEKRFEKGLCIYYSENVFKTAQPDDLISAFSKAYKSRLDTWFNGWLDGKTK